MGLISGIFLFNLLCGFIPCDPNFGEPKPSFKSYPEIGYRDRRPWNKSQMEPIVKIKEGLVKGYHMKVVSGRIIFAFEGIPYGKAERWKIPKRYEEWKETWDGTKRGSDCLQLSAAKMLRVYGSENCLFVNVFTPDLPFKGSSPNYPVIVYLHSGSWAMGSGSEHGPAYMLSESDIVLVTVNYRLGVLGFMSTGDKVLSGNYGLHDQALALEWIKDNIWTFGGDPANVNLMGYSAGGVSTHLHMISNRTRHLFKRAISLGSGSAYQNWGVRNKMRGRYYTNRIGQRFGCPTGNSKELVKCLKSVPVNLLIAGQLNLFDWFPFPPTQMTPVVEDEEDNPEAFLTISPEEAYQNGLVDKKPWIVGMTSHEGLVAVLVLELFLRWFPFRLYWNRSSKAYLDLGYLNTVFHENIDLDEVVDKVTKFYLGDKTPLEGNQFDYGNMLTHRYFHYGVIKGMMRHSRIAPTYGYYFSFRKGKYSMGNLFGHKSWEWAPGHAEDEYYFFNTSTQHPGFSEKDPDYKMGQVMINFLSNFVTNGEPTYTTDEGESIQAWEKIKNDASNIRVLRFNENVEMIDYPDIKEIRFWEGLGLPDMTELGLR